MTKKERDGQIDAAVTLHALCAQRRGGLLAQESFRAGVRYVLEHPELIAVDEDDTTKCPLCPHSAHTGARGQPQYRACQCNTMVVEL